MREDLLPIGIASLSKAGEGEAWFSGHFGSAIIAGYFLLNEFALDPPVIRLIAAKLDLILESFPAFFPSPPPGNEPPVEEASAILQQLEPAVLRVANSGHAVIYASLALRAMQRAPALQTASLCQNVATLVAATAQHDPSRYYGCDDPAAADIPEDALPEVSNLDALTRAAIAECERVYPDEEIAGRRHFFNGEKIHGVTHAQALADLAGLGHSSLAEKGRASLRRQLYLSRQTPPDPSRTSPRTELIPSQQDFWRAKATDGFHLVKLSYAALAAADRLQLPRAEVLGALAAVWNLD